VTLSLLRPAWPDVPGVSAAMSLRTGGASVAPYDSLNLGLSVGDEPATVQVNRVGFAAALGVRPVWLRLEHGARVLRVTDADGEFAGERADGAWTTDRDVAIAVGAADCMPVLFALRDGRGVAAAHAGWRGLAAGVLEATVKALCDGTGATPDAVQAWLGPCIGPRHFEVGADVLQAFGQDPARVDGARFAWSPRADGSARWRAHLPLLARDRLTAAGVGAVTDSGACTYTDASRFFSFRRDGLTGRMAAAIWRT